MQLHEYKKVTCSNDCFYNISLFSYCLLVCMSYSRTLNNRINKIHEKALRLVYKDETFLSLDVLYWEKILQLTV